jgi:hypothetical protein
LDNPYDLTRPDPDDVMRDAGGRSLLALTKRVVDAGPEYGTGGYDRFRSIIDHSPAELLKRISDRKEYANAPYRRVALIAAKLAILADLDPMACRAFLGSAAYNDDTDLGRLLDIDNFVRAIGDDHGYAIAIDDDGPTIVAEGTEGSIPIGLPDLEGSVDIRLAEWIDIIMLDSTVKEMQGWSIDSEPSVAAPAL